jgi:hypothetical protein
MKDPVLAIITRLKADAAVAAFVGTRVYRMILPTSPTFPAITVSRVDAKRQNLTHNRIRVAQSRIQCTAWAATDGVADNLSECIADSLNMVTDTYMSPGVFVIRIDDQGAVPDDNPDIPLWMYHRDFIVQYNV